MSLHYFYEPELNLPDMVCAWPGIGKVALIVAETLRSHLGAVPFAEVEPFPFFYPRQVTVHKGLLEDMAFPASRFYASRGKPRDIILFIGEAQPLDEEALYGDARLTYRLASLVLDVAKRFHCRRIYTSGAAVTQIHHTMPSRVWAVPNMPCLVDDLSGIENLVLMSQVTGQESPGSQGIISGLNGLLVGAARSRELEAVCLMGEVPHYLQGLGQPYPGAALAVLKVLSRLLGLSLDLSALQHAVQSTQQGIDQMLEPILADKRMAEFRRQIEALKQTRRAELGPITEEEQKAMLQHIEELFKTDNGSHRRLV